MKTATLLLSVLLLAITASARKAEPQAADFTAQYTVMNTSAVGSFMIGNFCTMAVRDVANPTLAFVLQRHGHGLYRALRAADRAGKWARIAAADEKRANYHVLGR
jgi:hypothetical protein